MSLRWFLPASLALVALAANATVAQAQTFQCGTTAGTAVEPPSTTSMQPPPPGPYHRLSWQDTTLNLGIGHLQAAEIQPFDTAWIDKALIPLFAAPGGKPWGWIAKGWLLHDEGKRPLGTAGMLETAYETPSFLVLEENPAGWLRFRFGLPADPGGGTAWLHRCHLANAAYPLRFERWEDRFLKDENVGTLFFRSKVRHSLRSGPGTDHERLAWIEGESYELEPLELQGDWMRVRVSQPAVSCAEPGAKPDRVVEGWTKWRSDDQGSWVWYHTRGC